MKIIITIYAISWLILLGNEFRLLFKRDKDTQKIPWYTRVLSIIFAPLLLFSFPFALLYNHLEEKKHVRHLDKLKEERENEEKYKRQALEIYKEAIGKPHDNHHPFLRTIAQTLVSKIEEKKYDSIMDLLDKLSLPKEFHLKVEECQREGIGQKSKFLVETDKHTYDSNIWSYLDVEDSLYGAWQAYLLYKMVYILPLFWHALYEQRTYLYSNEDVIRIEPIIKKDHREGIQRIVKNFDTTPDIVKIQDKYYVSCCYWNDFNGLIREIVEVSISTRNKALFKDINQQVLYHYHCGIRF